MHALHVLRNTFWNFIGSVTRLDYRRCVSEVWSKFEDVHYIYVYVIGVLHVGEERASKVAQSNRISD